MTTPYIGEIRMFGGNFAPLDWAFCDGQVLSIAQNDALFSLIGTTYGGDGTQTFALPDLRSRVPMHMGNGHILGEMGGAEIVTLNITQLPSHNHITLATFGTGNSSDPAGSIWAQSPTSKQYTSPGSINGQMSSLTITSAGGGLPHENLLPFQAINFIIALNGVFPSRP